MKKLLLILLFISAAHFAQEQIITKGKTAYLANKLVIKFSATQDQSFYKSTQIPAAAIQQLNEIGAISAQKVFPKLKKEAKNYGDLDRIQIIEYSSPYDPAALAKKISNSPDIEWAEPWYVYQICLKPDDPKYTDGTQWYLNKISAPQAWDISTGNEDIIIAINDTGVDWDHPDIANNIWINEDEIPDNGIDDDDNGGFIDDVRGWDFGGASGTPDNDPMEDDPTHGTYVAGLASAVSNNGVGVASIGYSCKIMPVKTSQKSLGNTNIIYGLQGILYAANNGAHVINCSWGGYSYSRALQNVITYAVSLGTVVVAAAGNDSRIDPFYPASYDGVISVGGSNTQDDRYESSNYGPFIDVIAPATGAPTGDGMYGIWQYEVSDPDAVPYIVGTNGTSLASPIVSGLAGLVIDRFPNYKPLQVAEQIRVNTDDIYENVDPVYDYYLGKGRINANKTLSNTGSISVRAEEMVYTDLSNGNGLAEPGEEFALGINFTNYLNPASNIEVTLVSRNDYVIIDNNHFTISSAETLEEVNNFNSPFSFYISENIPLNEDVEFLLLFNGAGYSDYQLLSDKFNTTFLTQDGNDIALTITSRGNLGYNDFGASPSEGDGLYFDNGSNLLYEGALIYGNSQNMIMDAAHVNNSALSDDFESVIPFSIQVPGEYADYQGYTSFNDNGANPNLGITTELFTYSFSAEEYSKFIILRYNFLNTTDTVINNFHAGLFFDLDFNMYLNDHTSWDYDDNFGYVFDEDPNESDRIDEYIAVALVSDTKYNYRAMSTSAEDPIGGVSLYPDFDSREKWLAISSATTIDDNGPDDIAFSVAGGPYTIQPHDSLNVAFAVAGGYSLEEVRTAVLSSREAYGLIPTSVERTNEQIPVEFSLSQNYPNPFNPSTKIKFTIPLNVKRETSNIKLIVYDILGREIKTLINKNLSPGNYENEFNANNLPSGVYFYRLTAGSFVETKKMILLR